jgi:hypothetical protein
MAIAQVGTSVGVSSIIAIIGPVERMVESNKIKYGQAKYGQTL